MLGTVLEEEEVSIKSTLIINKYVFSVDITV
jgi:hypothetical protein